MCFPPQPKAIARILLQQEKSTHTEATFPSVRETQTQVVCVSIRVVWKCRCNFPMCGCALLVLPTAFPPSPDTLYQPVGVSYIGVLVSVEGFFFALEGNEHMYDEQWVEETFPGEK